ncbi:MAG: hypothetical protein ACEY3D_06455 [Rickettsia sp.]|uniref:hypothetical protein n=1 Tax=Rickettsia sp. TaxID=789 RepID=UPI003978D764
MRSEFISSVRTYQCHSCESRNPEKNYKYSKFLKLKTRFISLYAGFLLLARNDIKAIQQRL